MNLEYSLNKDDYLTYQLFHASRSETITKKRRRNWLLVPISYLILGAGLFLLSQPAYLFTFAVLACIWFLGYPMYSRWLYKKNFIKFVEENYAGRIGRSITLTLTEEELLMVDETSEGKVLLGEFDHIFDIGTHVYLHMKSGNSVILPRVTLNGDVLEAFLAGLEERTGLVREEIVWEWK